MARLAFFFFFFSRSFLLLLLVFCPQPRWVGTCIPVFLFSFFFLFFFFFLFARGPTRNR